MKFSKELMLLNSKLNSGEITKEAYDLQLAVLTSKNQQTSRRNTILIIVGAVFLFFALITIIGVSSSPSSGEDETNPAVMTAAQESGNPNPAPEAPKVPAEYAGECPVSYTASIADNIIGVPEITCNIKNKTEKQIAAIRFYFEPTNVYGDTISGIFTANNLSTDDAIPPNGSANRSWQILDTDTAGGNIYLYSVYFSDGTEWGDRNAASSYATKYGVKVSVKK